MRNRHEEPKQGITVQADEAKHFELYQWREAFKFWQDKIWSGCYNKGMFPRKHGGNAYIDIRTKRKGEHGPVYASIVFDSGSFLYHATGHACPLSFDENDNRILWPGNNRAELENAVARFARNREFKGVVLSLPNPRYVSLLALLNERGHLKIGIQ